MFKAYCDKCNVECEAKTTSTRRTTHSQLVGLLGLEVIPLTNGSPSANLHVCESCLLDLFWEMVNRVPASPMAARLKKVEQDEGANKHTKAILDDERKKVQQLETASQATLDQLASERNALRRFEEKIGPIKLEFNKKEQEILALEAKVKQRELICGQRAKILTDREAEILKIEDETKLTHASVMNTQIRLDEREKQWVLRDQNLVIREQQVNELEAAVKTIAGREELARAKKLAKANAEETAQKIAEGQRRQAEIDAEENPDYVTSVARREARRKGGL